jgi:hypothetical protein
LAFALTTEEKARKNLSQGSLWHKHDEEQIEPNKAENTSISQTIVMEASDCLCKNLKAHVLLMDMGGIPGVCAACDSCETLRMRQ